MPSFASSQHDEPVGDAVPSPGNGSSQQACGGRGVAERRGGRDVGVDLVVDVGVLLVRAGDVAEVVAAGSLAHPAGPEPRGPRDHRPAARAQPGPVAGGQVVLPLRQRDVGGDVLLVQALAVDRDRRRDLLGAVERALPRVPGAAIATGARVGPGGPQALVAVGVHTGGQARVLGEQRREHPRLGVPEDVPAVPVRRQTGRRDAPVDAGPGAGPEVELAGVHPVREVGVSTDADPPGPQPRPRAPVARSKPEEACRRR